MTTDLDIPATVVRPDVPQAVETMHLFQKLKSELLGKEDTVDIQGKMYVKRSGWRKIQLAFNISTEIISVEREQKDSSLVVRIRARARAPNGRVAEEVGVCDSSEFLRGNLQGSFHNIESKAATRAINRAISDLVGGGEVSAEEVTQGGTEKEQEEKALQAITPEKFLLVTWKVRGEFSPVPSDTGPAGFLRKTIAGIEKAHSGAAIAISEFDGYITDLRVMGLDRATLEKDLTSPLSWTVQTIFEVGKDDVKVDFEENTMEEAAKP